MFDTLKNSLSVGGMSGMIWGGYAALSGSDILDNAEKGFFIFGGIAVILFGAWNIGTGWNSP